MSAGGIKRQWTKVTDCWASVRNLSGNEKSAAGVGGLPVVVGEVGWPTDGDKHATAAYAQKFYAGLLRKLAARAGTPLRPNQYIEVYLFGLIDEDAKSVAPGNFERHWGIVRYDGQPKYPMDLSGGQGGNAAALVAARGVQYLPRQWCVVNPNAPPADMGRLGDSVNYACSFADCTALGYGSSCNGLDAAGNASYAFNMYFQTQNQVEGSCDFQGLAAPTAQNPSTDTCNFTIQIAASAAAGRRWRRAPAATASAAPTRGRSGAGCTGSGCRACGTPARRGSRRTRAPPPATGPGGRSRRRCRRS